MTTSEIDRSKVEEFVGKIAGEAGASLSAVLAYIGDRLGLYKVMAEAGPVTSVELAARTGTNERMVREWLANQAAGGYVQYDSGTGTFALPAEHALALAVEGTPAFVAGLFQFIVAAYRDVDALTESFRSGEGLDWGRRHDDLYSSVERVVRARYESSLISEWIPALEGVEEKLERGARVADIGCGYGAALIILAKVFPNSSFIGFDSHPASVEQARKRAADAGVGDRIRFEVASSLSFPGDGYDLICYFDALHDMGDPLGSARHARRRLANDGTLLLVELSGMDNLEDNIHHPLGRIRYAISTIFCTPTALAQGGAALGAQAGESRLRALFRDAGFSQFRRAAETPFNLVFEARHQLTQPTGDETFPEEKCY